MSAGDGSRLEAAGIVLVRQRPGSAKGVLFVTLEDETGVANLVVWAKVFEANRRVLMSARMLAVRGHVQREGEVVHLVARRFTDLSADLASVGGRETSFPCPMAAATLLRSGIGSPDRGAPTEGVSRARPRRSAPSYRRDQGQDAGLPVKSWGLSMMNDHSGSLPLTASGIVIELENGAPSRCNITSLASRDSDGEPRRRGDSRPGTGLGLALLTLLAILVIPGADVGAVVPFLVTMPGSIPKSRHDRDTRYLVEPASGRN